MFFRNDLRATMRQGSKVNRAVHRGFPKNVGDSFPSYTHTPTGPRGGTSTVLRKGTLRIERGRIRAFVDYECRFAPYDGGRASKHIMCAELRLAPQLDFDPYRYITRK